MKRDRLQNINVCRVLDRIIDDMQIAKELRSFTYDDIKGALLPETSESRITEALRILVSEGILRDKSTLLGRPPRYLESKDERRTEDKKTGRKPNYYQIIQNQSALGKIFHIYLNEGIEKFLTSIYINDIIKKLGFSVVYDVINPYLEHFDFRRVASNSLLNLPFVIEIYSNQYKLKEEYCLMPENKGSDQSLKELNLPDLVAEIQQTYVFDERLSKIASVSGCRIKPIQSNRIMMLSQFDPKRAVAFYRDTFQVNIKNLFSNLYERSLITRSLKQFMEYDTHLSPFTSYPINSPSNILFSHPFQRIFDDVYLLSKADACMFKKRACTVYENFGDILFEYFRNNIDHIRKLEQWINQFIFQWNAARTNFDSIWEYLQIAYKEKLGSEAYYIYVKGWQIRVEDLETNKPLPYNYEKRKVIENLGGEMEEVIEEIFSPPIVDHMHAGLGIDFCDPYRNILSCECFEEDCSHRITYEQIMSDIKLRFAEFGWDYDKIEGDPLVFG